jgi:hypothetical protein
LILAEIRSAMLSLYTGRFQKYSTVGKKLGKEIQ